MIFYGVGNHGGGPTKANIDSIHRYDRMGSFGRMTMSSPRRYFDELVAQRGEAGMAALPVWTDDLQHHAPGCYSAHSGIKAWQRRAQAALLSAERWAVVGTLHSGLDYPRGDLKRAWLQVLFNQFHDVLPGSAIESAYDDARDQLGEAVAISKRIITRVHNVLARQVDIPFQSSTQPVLVFNPHPWPVTAEIEMQYGVQPAGVHVVDHLGQPVVNQRIQSVATTDDKGRGATAFEATVPALGHKLFRMIGGPASVDLDSSNQPAAPLAATETVLENALLRAEFDPDTGWLSSLLDKRTAVDLVVGAVGEHTQICADSTDTWGHRVVSYNWPGDAMRCTGMLLREDGPLRARLRVEREWGRSTMVEEFLLGHRSDALEVRVTIDWREPAHLLKMRFPVALIEPEATFEIPFGSLRRPVDAAEEPAQSWVDLSGRSTAHPNHRAGLAVINNAKHGYDVSPAGGSGNGDDSDSPSIGITALRSPVYSWHDPKLLDPDGFYSYQDQGAQTFSYLLVPHAGNWRTAGLARRAAELGSSMRAMLESFHPGVLPGELSFADDGAGPVMITAVKGSEDERDGRADLIVRAVETVGEPAEVTLELPLIGRTITASFGPSQIRTFRVPTEASEAIVEVDLIEWELRQDRPGGK